jgi:tRNA threonylcarbamoyladenosine biosynthesis protein TsaE
MRFVRRFETWSDAETQAVGRELALLLPRRAAVTLLGDLGAGKTTLTKGIVEGRGCASAEEVSSPTFTLIHEYGNGPDVYHIDLYRLETRAEAERLGLDEIFEQNALALVEWGDKFPEVLPSERFEIRFELGGGSDRRIITLFAPGDDGEARQSG